MTEEKIRILVVDDDVDILRGFRNILEKAGYIVETVATGKDALKKIQKEKFNVFLLDVKLPDMDGTELLLKIPRDYEAAKIIITGFSNEEAGKTAADYGANDYLVKPVKPEELLAVIAEKIKLLSDFW